MAKRGRPRRWPADKLTQKAIRAWYGMKTRCLNKNANGYRRYGGRGITICDRWRNDCAAFIADVGLPPTAQHTIDRIDNDKGYEPGNCRWATRKEQANNVGPSRGMCIGGWWVSARSLGYLRTNPMASAARLDEKAAECRPDEAERAGDLRKIARVLRLEVEKQIPHCFCHEIPRGECPEPPRSKPEDRTFLSFFRYAHPRKPFSPASRL